MTTNFRAEQVQTKQIIASGSLANGTGAKLVIYPIEASGTPFNLTGGIDQTAFNTGSLNGKDIFMFVSGGIGQKNSNNRSITVFGGDLHVSGNFSLDGNTYISGSLISTVDQANINYSSLSTIIGATTSYINYSTGSNMLGGRDNLLSSSTNALMIGGQLNELTGATGINSFNYMLGGYQNKIYNSDQSDADGGILVSSINGGVFGSIKNNVSDSIDSLNNNTAINIIGGLFSGITNNGVILAYTTLVNTALPTIILSGTNQLVGVTDYFQYNTILGGYANTYGPEGLINAYSLGGKNNTIQGGISEAGLIGGNGNQLQSDKLTATQQSVVIAGSTNTLNTSNYSSIIGGTVNSIDHSDYSHIFGSDASVISGSNTYSVIVGGDSATINGGSSDASSFGAWNSTITNGNGSFLVGGNGHTNINTTDSGIVGGFSNTMNISNQAIILGGRSHSITASSVFGVIAGGRQNLISGSALAGIFGGYVNSIYNGGITIADGTTTILGGYGNNLIGPSYASSIVGGKTNNLIDSEYCTIVGSTGSAIYSASYSTVIAGTGNIITKSSTHSSIVGGQNNSISASAYSFVGGGSSNFVVMNSTGSGIFVSSGSTINNSNQSGIVAGQANIVTSSSDQAIIAGGLTNTISASFRAGILGGSTNTIKNFSTASVILGGTSNSISGSQNSGIFGGMRNGISGSSPGGHFGNIIVGGHDNQIMSSSVISMIAASEYSAIRNGWSSVIVGSWTSFISDSSNYGYGGIYSCESATNNRSTSAIIAGINQNILSSGTASLESFNQIIAGGRDNYMVDSPNSFMIGTQLGQVKETWEGGLLGGWRNKITGSFTSLSTEASVLVGGTRNAIIHARDSIIVGGVRNLLSGSATSAGSITGSILIGSGLTSSLNKTVIIGGPSDQGYKFIVSASSGSYTSGSVHQHIPSNKQTTYTTLVSDYIIPVSSSGAGTTVTLPSTIATTGRQLIIKDVGGNAATFNCIVSSSFGKIDGAATYTISVNYGSVSLCCFTESNANNTWGVI